MRFVRISSTAAAFVFCATMTPAFAQHDGEQQKQGAQHENKQARTARQQSHENKAAPARQQRAPQAAQQQRQPARQQEHAQQVRQPNPPPQQQQQRAQQTQQQSSQQARNQHQPDRTHEQAQSWQQDQGWQHGGGWQRHDTWQGDRARNWSSDHRTWAQRGGYGGYYVPQSSFSLYFGSGHFFRLGEQPVMYMGYPQFEYRGYSFLMVDPYPENWSDNWYNSDDVYIDYDNGYYLHDRSYPDVRLAITVEL